MIKKKINRLRGSGVCKLGNQFSGDEYIKRERYSYNGVVYKNAESLRLLKY